MTFCQNILFHILCGRTFFILPKTCVQKKHIGDDIFYSQIIDDKCDPKNGEVVVDPQDYTEKLTIVFDKILYKAENPYKTRVISTEPEFPFTTQFPESNPEVLEITFADYIMPYNTKFVIRIHATSLSGNASESTYSFITKDKDK